jgi:CBS-domain-containing membrane protein
MKSPNLSPHFANYLRKFKGTHHGIPTPFPTLKILIWSFTASLIGIGVVASIHYTAPSFQVSKALHSLIGSFGATAVLLYAAIESPLAQPRNVVLGHVISALIGVSCHKLFDLTGHEETLRWLSAALSVAISIVAMQITKTLHPPGGATALIATTGGSDIFDLGYLYVVMPVLFGVLLMLAVALIVNNIQRRYVSWDCHTRFTQATLA